MPDTPTLPAWCRIDSALTVIKIQIRDAPDAGERLAVLFDLPSPTKNRFSAQASFALAAIAPGEWLLIESGGDAGSLVARIETAMRAETALIVDVTNGVIALRLEGPAATVCLAAYTAFDLRDTAMPAGSAIRTRFGDISVLVVRTGDAPEYLLITDQSYAPYLLELVARTDRSPR